MKIRNLLAAAILACAGGACALPAHAQYYQLANQIPQLLQPALVGGLNYKGFVEASYLKGLGNKNADFVEVSTSQGFRYADWFFMGAGVGVQLMFSHSDYGGSFNSYPDWDPNRKISQTGVIIPLYSDFRFNIGDTSKPSFFIGVKLGCSFLVSNQYIKVGDGMLTSNECFYLRPSMGVRIPTNKQNTRQAVNIGVNYQLMTSGYWYWNGGNDNITINGLGASISYEW